MIQRHSLFVLLALVATSSGSNSAQSTSTAVESRETKTSVWWPIVECVFLDDVNKCLQDRSVRAFIGLDRKDDIHIDTEKETVKMPGEQEEGIFEMLGDLVSDGIQTIFQNDSKKDEDDEDDEVEEGEEEAYEEQQAESGDNNKVEHEDSRSVGVDGNEQRSVETGRGKKKKKKKKKKQIKKAIIKLIILMILIKLKIAKFLYVFGKFLQFKLVLMITINTIINIIRFLIELKRKKTQDNVMYSYEQAHHQHHYNENHHFDPAVEDDDKGWLSGLWSRSGSYDGSGGVRSIAYAHDRAYSAQKPSQNSAYSVQELYQDAADYALRPGQGTTRSAQKSPQDSTGYRQTSTQHSARYWKKSTQNEENYDKKSAPNVGVYSYVQNSNSNDQRSP